MNVRRIRPTLWRPWVASALALALFPATGCEKPAPQRRATAVSVEVVEVEPGTFREVLRSIGTIDAAQEVEIRPDRPGHIREIRFERGARVDAGDLLVVLDDEELQEELSARRAELKGVEIRSATALRSFERIREVYKKGSATTEELDRARSEYEALETDVARLRAEIALIREQILDTRLHAPVAGTMSDHRVDVGDFVNRGEPIATLYSRSALEVRFTVGQQFIGKVHNAQQVRLSVDAWPDRTFQGSVAYSAPSVLETTRRLPVVAVVDDPEGDLKPGMFASVQLVVSVRKDVPGLPEEALVAGRQGYSVFVVEDGKARRRDVEIGLREPGRAEIRRGLDMGQTVVRTGQLRLRDGQEVRVVTGPSTRKASADPTDPSADGPTTRRAATGPDADSEASGP